MHLNEFRPYEQSAPLAATVNSCDIFVSRITCILAKMQGAGLQTAFTADYVPGISIYIHATVRSFGPLLDTSAIRGKNMKHSD